MIYFDNKYLLKYLTHGKNLHVFVGGEWLSIADSSDLESPEYGVGYEASGKGQQFSYQNITSIEINGIQFTLDQLNQSLNPEPQSGVKGDKEEKDTSKGEKEDTSDDEITIDPKKESKIRIGDSIINTDPKSQYYNTRGQVVSITEQSVTYKTYVQDSFRHIICLKKFAKRGWLK